MSEFILKNDSRSEPRLLKIPAIAERLGISRTKAYELAHKRQIPAWKLGAEWVASTTDLDAFIVQGPPMLDSWLSARGEA